MISGRRRGERSWSKTSLLPLAAVLELQLLHEIRRLVPTAKDIVAAPGDQVGLRICDLPFSTVVQHALAEKWARDPID
jgi:hypothetical protein